ncbi:MAG: conjugal transfer protein TraD [Paracoccaceae bacterium]
MRNWQVDRRKRTRHLIELGGLVVKAGIVDLAGDDRALIYGTLIWVAEKLQSAQAEHAREVWTAKGTQAFAADRESEKDTVLQAQHDPK